MLNATVLTDRFDRAMLYATHVHGGQVRKGTSTPYVAHLLAVAATVLEYDGSEDMAIAALLHDAVEDQGGEPRLSDIRNRFGDRVADIVRSCSDSVVNTSAGQQKDDTRTRKIRYIEHLDTADQETLLVSLSDKIHKFSAIFVRSAQPCGNDLTAQRKKHFGTIASWQMHFRDACRDNWRMSYSKSSSCSKTSD
jgi:(p)ppGpp synthase/HD superfamily hydrolase